MRGRASYRAALVFYHIMSSYPNSGATAENTKAFDRTSDQRALQTAHDIMPLQQTKLPMPRTGLSSLSPPRANAIDTEHEHVLPAVHPTAIENATKRITTSMARRRCDEQQPS